MPQSSRTFRIFVSSTFSDLKAERNALQARVFPRLRALAAQHNCRFQVIDLRWGVSEEASLDQQAMDICLGEIARCQQTSPRPNFVVLLGDRYGWCPPPAHIPANAFDNLLTVVEDKDQALLKAWYQLDENAAPPERRLKPREPGGPYETYAAWQPVEARLHTILDEATHLLNFTDEQRLPYTASATEQEIAAGALRVKDAPEHVLCFFRSIEGLPRQADPATKDFLDWDDATQTVDEAAHSQQKNLKDRLAVYVPNNVYTYPAQWMGSGITTTHIDRLCEDVYNALSRIILAEIEHPHPAAPVEKVAVRIHPSEMLDDEGRAHHQFAEERLRFFVGRSEMLAKIEAYLKNSQRRALAIAGAGGTGKSALVAKAIQQAQTAHPQAQLIYRFIGASPGSSDGRSLLESLCREISRRYGANQANIPMDYRDLVSELGARMALATSQKPLILFLDSLDQLSANQGARNLTWLPNELPEHVSVVASTRPEDTLVALKGKPSRLEELGGLSRAEGDDLLSQWLGSAHRALQPAQRAAVLACFEQSQGNPLYLKLAFEEARLWVSGLGQPPESLAQGVSGIIEQNMIGRLAKEGNHGELLVSRALGYLAASRYGLAEDELVDLLSRDLEVYDWFFKNSFHVPADLIQAAIQSRRQLPSPAAENAALDWLRSLRAKPQELAEFLTEILHKAEGPRLPVVLWSRLSFDLAPYLAERLVDGVPMLSFYHRELGDVSANVFLEGAAQTYHARLADYFCSKADPEANRSWAGGDRHALSELPYHLTQAARFDDVYDILTDFKFLEHKAAEVGVMERKDEKGNLIKTYSGVLQLQEDYEFALSRIPGAGGSSSWGDRPPLILTALETSAGLKVYCPVCNNTSPIKKELLDSVITCPFPGCGARLKLNPFVINRE